MCECFFYVYMRVYTYMCVCVCVSVRGGRERTREFWVGMSVLAFFHVWMFCTYSYEWFMYMCARAHTHTHTHIYIYIYKWIGPLVISNVVFGGRYSIYLCYMPRYQAAFEFGLNVRLPLWWHFFDWLLMFLFFLTFRLGIYNHPIGVNCSLKVLAVLSMILFYFFFFTSSKCICVDAENELSFAYISTNNKNIPEIFIEISKNLNQLLNKYSIKNILDTTKIINCKRQQKSLKYTLSSSKFGEHTA